MSHSISVDMRSMTLSSATAGNRNGGQSIDARIAALKQKLADVFDELKQAVKKQSPETEEKVKLLQMQIQVLQAQIMQLETLKQQKMADEQRAQEAQSASRQPAESDLSSGQNINTFI